MGRRGALVLVLTSVAIAIGGWVLWSRWSNDDWVSRASDWEEPDPETAERAREFLEGDGAELLALSDFAGEVSERVGDGASEDECGDLVEEWDENFGGERQLELLNGLPDAVLGGLWATESVVLADALGFCVAGAPDQSQAAAGALTRYGELIDRRLSELGVAG